MSEVLELDYCHDIAMERHDISISLFGYDMNPTTVTCTVQATKMTSAMTAAKEPDVQSNTNTNYCTVFYCPVPMQPLRLRIFNTNKWYIYVGY